MAEQTNQYAILPSDEASKKKIMDAIKEISDAKTRIEGERSYIKESIGMIAEEFKIRRGIIAKLANLYHKQNAKDVRSTTEEILLAYEVLTGEDTEE